MKKFGEDADHVDDILQEWIEEETVMCKKSRNLCASIHTPPPVGCPYKLEHLLSPPQ
jgi:hypothetical protein